MPKRHERTLYLERIRELALALDTKSMRAIQQAKQALEVVSDPEASPWAALALSRLGL